MLSNLRLGALALALLAGGCQPTPSARDPSGPSGEQPIEYGAQMRMLFDDDLGGISLGAVAAPVTPEGAKLLARRILAADAIIACQIQTITEGSAGSANYARLEFRGAGLFLPQARHAECPVISVSSQSYSFLLIHDSSNALIGKSIVLFLRTFNESGRETLHWHGEPDGVRIREEVKRIGSPIR